jgi:hypothetical protein
MCRGQMLHPPFYHELLALAKHSKLFSFPHSYGPIAILPWAGSKFQTVNQTLCFTERQAFRDVYKLLEKRKKKP